MSRIPRDIQAILLIFLAAGASATVVTAETTSPRYASISATPTATPHASRRASLPRFIPGPLDGQITPRSHAARRPIAVTVGNLYPSARPQAGLMQASVIFETLVEGGITRLMPIFLEHDSRDVGPIRSARPYFVKWAAGFHAILVHAGGSAAARRLLSKTFQVGNVDALSPHAEFTRDPARVPPDDLFGGTTGMRAIAQRAGFNRTVVTLGWHYRGQLPRARDGHVVHIHVEFSTPDISSPQEYVVDYHFDSASDSYSRSVGSVPAIDRAANRPLTAQNIVVLYTSIRPIPGDALGRVSIAAVGSGPALIFRDGLLLRGRWSKAAPAAPLTLSSARGRPISLTPGQTWVEVTTAGDATWGRR